MKLMKKKQLICKLIHDHMKKKNEKNIVIDFIHEAYEKDKRHAKDFMDSMNKNLENDFILLVFEKKTHKRTYSWIV